MEGISVKIRSIVTNLAKNVKFMQPVYEAIMNSLEAHADKVTIDFSSAPSLNPELPSSIDGFTITDNGDGFTTENQDSFCTLWSERKVDLGCKGSGRFTWLTVFSNVEVTSRVKSEGGIVRIPFSTSFSRDKIHFEKTEVSSNETTIVFRNVTSKFYSTTEKGTIDKRPESDLNKLTDQIQDYLLLKLFLLKQNGRHFFIALKLGNETREISDSSIPSLDKIDFFLSSNTYAYNGPESFSIYYLFRKDNQARKRISFCSSGRPSLMIEASSVGIFGNLPNRDSMEVMVLSTYFNDKDDDKRNGLPSLTDLNEETIDCPITLSSINQKVRSELSGLLARLYPSLSSQNDIAKENAISEYPFLAPLIKENNDLVKTKDTLISQASTIFAKRKTDVKNKYSKCLKERNVNPEEFLKAVNEMSFVTATELGEYIFYRQSIVDALKDSANDPEKNEKFVHDIFMPMQTDSFGTDSEKEYLSNLWIIDDKFMTYLFAASDKTIKQISDAAFEKAEKVEKAPKRPDLVLFFNQKDGEPRDAVLVEFKGVNANADEKNKSLVELPNNIAYIRKNCKNISSVWGYVITTIDEDMRESIENQGNFQTLFSGGPSPIYIRDIGKDGSHMVIVDLRSIATDASMRNSLFLEILKRSKTV
jgi:hypothetical protein